MKSLTTDTFFNGRIQVKQNRSGYRFSIDAVLLAWHVSPRLNDTVLDLGTGCGIIPMILAYRYSEIKIFGIELQTELAQIAKLNVAENDMDDRIVIHQMDMKTLGQSTTAGPVDLVISNPPYRKPRSGRKNPDHQRAVARHEIEVTLNDVVETARRMLKTSGRLAMIYPVERLVDILMQMRSVGIEPKFMRLIYSEKNAAAKLILIEGKKGGRAGLKTGPPLIIYRQNGVYSDEVKKMLIP